jgi:hypothetical protein
VHWLLTWCQALLLLPSVCRLLLLWALYVISGTWQHSPGIYSNRLVPCLICVSICGAVAVAVQHELPQLLVE